MADIVGGTARLVYEQISLPRGVPLGALSQRDPATEAVAGGVVKRPLGTWKRMTAVSRAK
jgi:hypothetical protein